MSLLSDIKLLFPVTREQTGYVRVKCPYHKGGQERKPSMSILLEAKDKLPKGYARCFTCGWVGSFLDIAQDFGMQYVPDFDVSAETEEAAFSLCLEKAVYKKDVPFLFSDYLAKRGIPESTQKKFKTYNKEEEQKVYFPVFSKEGVYLYNCARTTIPGQKAFFVETGRHKSLGCIEEIDFAKSIAVCESQIDAYTLWTMGVQCVATLGAQNTGSLSAIKNAIGPFLLAFDPDAAGIEARKKAASLLGAYRCDYLDLPVGKDINNIWQDFAFNTNEMKAYLAELVKPCL